MVDDWDKCSADALGGTRQNRENVGAQYTLGGHVSKWGCSCVGTNPTLWFGIKPNIVYVAEDVSKLCEAFLDEIGSALERQSRDDATCSGFVGSASDVMQ